MGEFGGSDGKERIPWRRRPLPQDEEAAFPPVPIPPGERELVPRQIIRSLAARHAYRTIRAAVDGTLWFAHGLINQFEGIGKALKSFREIRVEKPGGHTHRAAVRDRRLWLLVALFLMATKPKTTAAHRAGDASLTFSNQLSQSQSAISRDRRSASEI